MRPYAFMIDGAVMTKDAGAQLVRPYAFMIDGAVMTKDAGARLVRPYAFMIDECWQPWSGIVTIRRQLESKVSGIPRSAAHRSE